MKTQLLDPIKFRIPFELLYGDKEYDPLTKLGFYLKSAIDTDKLINVSKIWINSSTDKKIDDLLVSYLMKRNRISKKLANQRISWMKLQYGPAVDTDNLLNLEDGYIYVESDYGMDKNIF